MKKISDTTVSRLSLYLRVLRELESQALQTVSSEELARRVGTTAAQVRKDLSSFGTFGIRGRGYAVAELVAELRSILGLERRWRVALVGAGKIGAALHAYRDFERQGFRIEAIFDADPAKVGEDWRGVTVRAVEELESVLGAESIEIVVLAVPAEAAQRVTDRVVAAGVRGILNFAPVKLAVPGGVALKNVNMAAEMEGLSYALARRDRQDRGGPGKKSA
jgi:redox-sensing transcriptional repressor